MTEDQMMTMVLDQRPAGQEMFMKKYRGLVRSVVSRYLNNPDDVEEVVQDAFVRIFRGLEKFRGECKLETWMTRVASSAALSRIRWSRSRVQWEGEETVDLERMSGEAGGSRIEQKEASWWLSRAILHLNEKDEVVITRFYLQEQSIQEICRDTGWTESDVKSRLCRARQRLRVIIEERYRAMLLN